MQKCSQCGGTQSSDRVYCVGCGALLHDNQHNKKKLYTLVYVYMVSIFIISCLLHFIGYFTYAIGMKAAIMFLLSFVNFGIFVLFLLINRPDFTEFFDNCNKVLLTIGVFLALYVWVAFFVGVGTLADGSAIVSDGQFFLELKGSIIKEIDVETYEYLRFAEYRILTGHPVVFTFIPAVFFSYKYNQEKQAHKNDE